MRKILIADDNEDVRELVGYMLTNAGYEVVVASQGEEALNLARRVLPDLILLDVRMPLMSGYQVCENLKSDPAFADIPVIFLTVRSRDEEIQKGYEVGARDYLIKPVKMDELLGRISSILG